MKIQRFFSQRIWNVIFCVVIFASQSFGLTYYVSSAGNDANNGTSTSTPWKTITKVNSVSFVSGDAIYFRCGDKFTGQINLNQSNITLGSFGSGNKPVITGAVQLTGWTVYSGSIYVAQASSFVKNLYANGVQMTIARFPNTGFLLISSKTNSTTFTSSGITQPSGYWNGATCRVRTIGWTFESPTVSTQSGTTIVLTAAPRFDYFKTNWGFYLDNKLAALDVEREWFCDPSNNKVYFYAPGGVDPNTLNVLGSTLDYGVDSPGSSITVRDLEFDYQVKGGLNFSSAAGHITILSNSIYGGFTNGIHTAGPDCTISNNTIQNVNGNGIQATWGTNCIISNNIIKSIGIVKGYQSSAMAYGIVSSGTYTTISNNYIDSTGYTGIIVASHDLVQQNVIKNTMLTLSDGAAIYVASGSTYTTIQNNIISDVIGNNEGASLWVTIYRSWSLANGIYVELGSNNNVFRDNTIIRAKSIALMTNYGTRNNTFRNNTCYDCASNDGGYFLYVGMDLTLDHGGHVFTKNILYPASSKQTMVQIVDFSDVYHSVGIIDSNYYLNSHGNPIPFEVQLKKASGWSSDFYTFTGWKTLTGQETHSKYITPASDTIFVNSTASPMTVNLPTADYYDLDNNSVGGSIVLAPYSSKVLIQNSVNVNPTITVNPTSLSFGNININTSSDRTYTLSGSNLTPSSGNITVTAPSTAFQVSLTSGSGFASSLNIPYSGGTLPSRTIYIRFSPTALQNYTGNITSAGGGAATKNVSVTGTGVSASSAVLSVNPTSLSFGNVAVNTNSNELTYTVQGSNLSPAADSITITASSRFTISTVSGSGFASSKRIAYTGGTLSPTTIYVRFSPTSVSGYAITITNAGGGAAIKNVSVIGTGVSASSGVLSVNSTSLSFGNVAVNTNSSELTYTLSGSNLSPASGNITVTSPSTNFQVSLTSGSGFVSSLNIPYTGGTLSLTTIYVRFSPTALQNYTGNITSTGGGAATINVSVIGNGVSSATPVITVFPESIAFSTVPINTNSSEQTYTVQGSNLSPASGNIVVTALSTVCKVSLTTGSGFASSLNIPYTGGTLSPTTIYVRFTPTSVSGYAMTITNAGGGAATKNVSVIGTGTASLALSINGALTAVQQMYPLDDETITLQWTSQNADSASISPDIGAVSLNGSQNVLLSSETQFILTLSNGTTKVQYPLIVGNSTTSVHSESIQPTKIGLEQNYPNPFNPSTVINYQLSVAGKVRLSVYDLLGREIATLVDGKKEAGNYSEKFDGSKLSSGVYFTRFIFTPENGEQIMQVKKLLLAK